MALSHLRRHCVALGRGAASRRTIAFAAELDGARLSKKPEIHRAHCQRKDSVAQARFAEDSNSRAGFFS